MRVANSGLRTGADDAGGDCVVSVSGGVSEERSHRTQASALQRDNSCSTSKKTLHRLGTSFSPSPRRYLSVLEAVRMIIKLLRIGS